MLLAINFIGAVYKEAINNVNLVINMPLRCNDYPKLLWRNYRLWFINPPARDALIGSSGVKVA